MTIKFVEKLYRFEFHVIVCGVFVFRFHNFYIIISIIVGSEFSCDHVGREKSLCAATRRNNNLYDRAHTFLTWKIIISRMDQRVH